MFNHPWKWLVFLLWTLGFGLAQAQICKPESIPVSASDSQFQDNSDGTITDLKTGLMWKQCSEGKSGADCDSGGAQILTWEQALQWVKMVNTSGGFAGHNDWRLPNIKELSSLVALECSDPAINLTRYPNTPSSGYWSSSVVAGDVNYAWRVFFSNGSSIWYEKFNGSQLRLVRSN